LALALALLAAACTPVPRPAIMSEVDAAERSAAAREAKTLAPTAYTNALKLHREAEAAFQAGDIAGAQMLSEHALAAHAHALALARIARAESDAKDAEAALRSAQAEVSSLDGEQARVSAEAEAIEMRIKVARDAEAVSPSGAADPAREKARVAAARSLSLEARMLCTAARMLLPGAPDGTPGAPAPVGAKARPALTTQLDEALGSVTKLDAALAAGGPAPIDLAMRARAGCLEVLTGVRRAMTPVASAPGAGDELLAEISETRSFSPSRDDRGVVITLRELWTGDKLTPAAEGKLATLGRIAAAHPRFPVAVVVHQDKEPTGKEGASWRARADAVAAALKAAKAPAVEVLVAGAALPVVDPAGGDRARNARVEIVFITPDTF
jgi:hypothetical protein